MVGFGVLVLCFCLFGIDLRLVGGKWRRKISKEFFMWLFVLAWRWGSYLWCSLDGYSCSWFPMLLLWLVSAMEIGNCDPNDICALLQFAVNVTDGSIRLRWFEKLFCCNWDGLACDNGSHFVTSKICRDSSIVFCNITKLKYHDTLKTWAVHHFAMRTCCMEFWRAVFSNLGVRREL